MLMILSPAKSLNFKTPAPPLSVSQPRFLEEASLLMARLRALSPAEIARLMGISDTLAALNFTRFAEWSPPFSEKNAKPAVLAFDGDVYDGLAAKSLSAADLAFAQGHLRILSGLYGVLRPLDLIQAYRLEMGARLDTGRGKDLYAFWGEKLLSSINDELSIMPRPVVVNLASEEYFKALVGRKIRGTVVQPVFEDWKSGRYKIISFYAKRARGEMARHAIVHRLTEPEDLKDFAAGGYAFAPEASDDRQWIFRRREE